jgi:hypothetical protein
MGTSSVLFSVAAVLDSPAASATPANKAMVISAYSQRDKILNLDDLMHELVCMIPPYFISGEMLILILLYDVIYNRQCSILQ